jgi:hypothetical protein
MHPPTVAHRTTGPAPPDRASTAVDTGPLLFTPLAACLSPRGDAAVMVARLRNQLARLDGEDRAYIADLVCRHIVAGAERTA